jgi:hypothetical protein
MTATHVARVVVASVLAFLLLPDARGDILYEPAVLGPGLEVTATGDPFGNGVAFADLEGDGDLDIYITDGIGNPNRLFENQGGFSFVEVMGALGAGDTGDSKAACFADYDNDGDPDLFVTNWGSPNKLYRNDGPIIGFTDASVSAGIGQQNYYSCGIAWADVDNDGFLDIYVGNRGWFGNEPNELYMNQGNGSFVESAAAMGVASLALTFQPLFTDYDRDGDQDLYLANDRLSVNGLYRNDGGVVFTDVSAQSGTDFAINAMGNASSDVNDDGYPDFYVTNTAEGNVCLVSNGDGTYDDEADALGLAVNVDSSWGCTFLDADLDGYEDLFDATGAGHFVEDPTPNALLRNPGSGAWEDVSAPAGIEDPHKSFGTAVGDLDGDGDLDIYVSNYDTECEVYRNVTAYAGHWLHVRPEGILSNRDAIGARVEVKTGDRWQFREIQAGNSYLSQSPKTAYFGLGDSTKANIVRVRWPSGHIDAALNVPADQVIVMVESLSASSPEGNPASSPLRLTAGPNPFGAALRIFAQHPAEGPARFRIVDATGREVARFDFGRRAAGILEATWDGRTLEGRRPPAGSYWVEFESAGAKAVRRVVAIP